MTDSSYRIINRRPYRNAAGEVIGITYTVMTPTTGTRHIKLRSDGHDFPVKGAH